MGKLDSLDRQLNKVSTEQHAQRLVNSSGLVGSSNQAAAPSGGAGGLLGFLGGRSAAQPAATSSSSNMDPAIAQKLDQLASHNEQTGANVAELKAQLDALTMHLQQVQNG